MVVQLIQTRVTGDASIHELYHSFMTHPLDPVANEPPSTESQDKEPIQGQLKSRKPLGVSFLDTKVANAAVTVGNGRGYVKPVNGIQTKGFAQSAQRRSSLQTLGSIERLQEFYSKKSLKHNKSGMLGFSLAKLSEEPEDLDRLPTPVAPPPSWHNLDVETDLDVLMQHMFDDIEIMLTAWAIIVGPPSESEQVQVLPLLQTVTEMLNSVKNYILHRHDLTEFAMNQLRSEALKVLETMSHLETKYRSLEDGNSTTEGYLYNTSDFGMLDQERAALLAYLDSVEKYALNPPHHVGSPYAGYSAEIKKLMIKASGPGPQGCTSSINLDGLKASRWVDRKADWESELARSYAMIVDTIDDLTLTDPRVDRDAFLQGLTDGIILCTTYNGLVKKSRRSFGLINKIHQDTLRTYRATENLSFFAAACKFRFDTVFTNYKPAEIARKTPAGLDMLEDALSLFTSAVVKEFNFSLQQTRRKSRFIDVASLSIS